MRESLTETRNQVKESVLAAERARRGVLMGSLSEQVYARVRHQIITGEAAPGSKLVELDIAARMGTSQGTVREALQRLEREGLVERKAHRATYVTAVAPDEMYEIFSVRSSIESFAIRRAIRHITAKDIETLENLVETMRQSAVEGGITKLVEHDLTFHRLLCEWSGSRVLLNAWTPLYAQIQRYIVQMHPHYFADLRTVADTHLPVLQALRDRDADAAASLVKEHIMLMWSWASAQPPGDDPGL
jgi:DNA-binding GntR family transcriptional regulator